MLNKGFHQPVYLQTEQAKYHIVDGVTLRIGACCHRMNQWNIANRFFYARVHQDLIHIFLVCQDFFQYRMPTGW